MTKGVIIADIRMVVYHTLKEIGVDIQSTKNDRESIEIKQGAGAQYA